MKLTKEARKLIDLEHNREMTEKLMQTFERSYLTLLRWRYAKHTPFYKKFHKKPFLEIVGMTEEQAFEPYLDEMENFKNKHK